MDSLESLKKIQNKTDLTNGPLRVLLENTDLVFGASTVFLESTYLIDCKSLFLEQTDQYRPLKVQIVGLC